MIRKSLRLLLVEDVDDDASLVLAALERHGYEIESTRVMAADAFRSALATGKFEIILCDYAMPSFDAVAALEILHESGKDIPLLIVSGTIGETVAVEAMRRGAADYLLKDNLIRLGAAVDREIRESEVRRQKRQFDSFSRSQTEVLEMILNRVPLARILERITERVEILSSEELCCSITLANLDGDQPPSAVEPTTPDDLCGCYSIPIFSSQHAVLGTMVVRHRSDYTLPPEELRWMESASRLASLAIERSRAADATRANELRYFLQRNALIALTKDAPSDSCEILDTFRRITETTSKTLGAARVSIWRYTENQQAIECLDLYQLDNCEHSSGLTLIAADYPAYFKELSGIELIAADDAQTDPRTCEFTEGYLIPLGIRSMMDVPIHLGSTVNHFLCNEHIGPLRHWTADEKTFAVAIANLISLALESSVRARAQQEVLTSHQRFQSVAAATNDTIWDWNLETDAFWWNDGFANLFGWSAAEVGAMIHVWIRQIHPEDRSRVVTGIYSAIQRGDSHWSDEYRFIRNDGSVAYVLDRGQVIRDAQGKGIRMVGGMMDLTENRAAELDRQQAEARIHEQASLLDKAQDAIMVRDLDHTITYWNKSAERLYGWTAEDALGRSVEGLLYRDVSAFERAHEQTLRIGEWMGEMTEVDKSGHELTIEGRWTLVRDDQGRPQSVFVINTDISEHRKLEQQFLRAQRLESIGTLAGGIAHDLNNILAPISMAIELLKMRGPDERSSELLDTIASSAKRGADMVGQVLSFARGMEGCRVKVHPRQILLEIENILRDTFLRNAELEVRAGNDLWAIHGDPTQLHQVLLNLCVNARDAIRGGGKIRISAENVQIDRAFAATNLEAKEGPHVCIQVEDNGEGIPPEIMDKIFDPFFTTKSVGNGTGLGLSTSLAIIKSHGGFIRVTSKPGEGTCFSVYLPALPELAESPPTTDQPDLPQGSGETVLIVDDEISIRQITQQTLEAFGYRTLLAANGDEAISLYAESQSDINIVLTDMMMPIMDGPATIEQLMKINPLVKIIATSGVAANRERALAIGKGVQYFLPKPYTAEILLKCLKSALASPAGER